MIRPKRGLRVGVLLDSPAIYQASILNGFIAEMRTFNVSVFTYALYPRGLYNLNSLSDETYQLVDPALLDGLFIYSSQLGQSIDDAAFMAQLARFGLIPKISLARQLLGIPSVQSDNQGYRMSDSSS
jgi:hypothetical protein